MGNVMHTDYTIKMVYFQETNGMYRARPCKSFTLDGDRLTLHLDRTETFTVMVEPGYATIRVATLARGVLYVR